MGIMNFRPNLSWEWRVLDPGQVGISATITEKLEHGMAAGDFPGLHGFLVVRSSSLVVERYFEGTDQRWGVPLGNVDHSAESLHDVRSVTKSIVSLLYGIALSEELVPSPSARLLDQFPEYPDLAAESARRKMKISHALSMQLGIAWQEGLNYSDPNNGEIQMEAAADRYRNILERPLINLPGSNWNYCGGTTALLGRIIAKGTNLRLETFARSRLFEPLGISNFEWVNGSDGEASASSGLRLTARDLAKIGHLILKDGQLQGQEILSRNWLRQSFKARANAERDLRYGYQWWLGHLLSNGKPWYGAFGNGGQRLLIIPSLDMVVVILAGNYSHEDQWKLPVNLMNKIVMASLRQPGK